MALNTVPREMMTAEIARKNLEVFESEPNELGETRKFLRWIVSTKRCLAGSFAGTIRPTDGYYSVTLLGCSYSGNRLIHLIEHGEWPIETEPMARVTTPRQVRLAPVPLTAEQRAELRAKLRAKNAAQ